MSGTITFSRTRAELDYCTLYGACEQTMELLEHCVCAECTERRTLEYFEHFSLDGEAK